MSIINDLLVRKKFILLDSAMGTELQNREIDTSLPLWSSKAIIENPDTIRLIHIENVDAGADIITTNTFRTQRRIFEKAGYLLEGKNYSETAFRMTRLACELALEAKMITRDELIVAGCIAPLADSYKPEETPDFSSIETEQSEHINNLIGSGVNILIAETMSDINEINIVADLLDETKKEFMFSLLIKDKDTLYSGASLKEAVKKINSSNASALLFNCISPSLFNEVLPSVRKSTELPIGFYGNVGDPEKIKSDGKVDKHVSEQMYYDFAKKWIEDGVSIIGGCCGTTPAYIQTLNKLRHKIL